MNYIDQPPPQGEARCKAIADRTGNRCKKAANARGPYCQQHEDMICEGRVVREIPEGPNG